MKLLGPMFCLAAFLIPQSRHRIFTVAAYGAVGDGITDDTAALNRAERACATGNGLLLFDSGKIYRVRRANPASQWPGGLELLSGCNLSGYGATIYIDDDTNGLGAVGGGLPRTIAADVKAGDKSLTLNSTRGLAKGQLGYFCYNRIPSNPAECSSHGFATITGVHGNTIALNRQLSDLLSVAATPAANRWFVVSPVVENVSIEGLAFTANWARGASIEQAIDVRFGRNLVFKNLTFTEPGGGAIVLQFVDGAKIQNVTVTSAARDGGAPSKGRCLSFNETENVQTVGLNCSNFRRAAIDIEAGSHNLSFDKIVLHDTDSDAQPGMQYFGAGDGSDYTVGAVTIDGTGYVVDSRGRTRGMLNWATGPVTATFTTVIDRTVNGVGRDGGLQMKMTIRQYVRHAPNSANRLPDGCAGP